MAVLTPAVAIATAARPATDIANAILRAGGNAFDAAAAAGFALAVCEPEASGLGGQATAVALLADGSVVVVDGEPAAPSAATRRSVSRSDQHAGHRATTVPTMPAVLDALRERYGRLATHDVISPSADLAARGVPMTALHAQHLRRLLRSSGGPLPFVLSGRARAGTVLAQPRLADTLERLARHGVADFFHGEIAAAITADMQQHGGLLNGDDLARASCVIERVPVETEWLGRRIVTAPPPGGGLQLLVTLALADTLRSDSGLPFVDAVAEASSIAFTDAHRPRIAPGDHDAVATWLAPDRIAAMRAAVLAGRSGAAASARTNGGDGPGDTTHVCVSDSEGNVVSLTQSIQSSFGAKVANEQLGFFYNNYLTTLRRRGEVDVLRPCAVPRSNAAPTIVTAGGRPVLALGAAGSRRIISSITQTLLHVVRDGRPIDAAIAAGRVHGLADRSVWIERPLADGTTSANLALHFDRVNVLGAHDHRMGCVNAIAFDEHGIPLAAADPRRDGTASTEEPR